MAKDSRPTPTQRRVEPNNVNDNGATRHEMSGRGGVPNAWDDDDWEKVADHVSHQGAPAGATGTTPGAPLPAPRLTKAARKAQHIEHNKQLWDSADNPARHHWLETRGVVPLKQDYQVPVTLLSRKPPANARRGDDDDDDDSEEERRKKLEADFEERQRRAKIEREEKQKRYAEARERIMGASKPTLASSSRDNSQARDSSRRPPRGGKLNGTRRGQPQSSKEPSPSPTPTPAGNQQLFDPDLPPQIYKRESSNTTPKEDQPVRQPRGPDNSGRGGVGFASRGGMLAS